MPRKPLAEAIDALEFDTVFVILEPGTEWERPEEIRSVYAPTVTHDPESDVSIDGGRPWECLTGMTGQYGYNGAVMHPSEFVGSGIADRLAEMAQETPGTMFAMVVVNDDETDEETGETDLIGWAIAYLPPAN